MRERDIEKYLRVQVKAAGGRAYKFESPGNAGVPDRMLSFPGDRIAFVELKAPGGKQTSQQRMQAGRLLNNGHTAVVIDSKHGVDEFLSRFLSGGVVWEQEN